MLNFTQNSKSLVRCKNEWVGLRFQIFIGFKNSAEKFLSFELFFFATITTKHAIHVPDNFFDLDVALIELPKRQSFDFDPELNVNSICLFS